MRRISSAQTFLMKKIVPVLWLCVLVAIFATGFTQGAFRREPWLLVMPLILLMVGISVYRKMIWDLADEVHDGGDFLKVRKGNEEDTIPLAGIINVSASTHMNPPRITLKLATPGRFGDEVVFSPIKPFSFNVFAKNPTAEDRIMRVDAARRGLVRRH
jgi:hypothetical protein